YRDELYEQATGRSGTARLQQFGVILGYRRVVIYVQPDTEDEKTITTNTARTQLLIERLPLPWSEWASEFREQMPDQINALMDEVASKSESSDQSQSIRERLKDILDLYRVSRYRAVAGGESLIDESRRTRGGMALRADVAQAGAGGGRPGG